MSCTWTQERLFDYLDRTLDRKDSARVETHLGDCSECAAYARALEEPHDAQEEWTATLIRRTAGNPCDGSESRLPDWVDGTLERVDAELVGDHLQHCAPCTALTAVHRALVDDLPELAEFEPDTRFLQDVLTATLPRPVVAMPWAARIDGWIAQLLQRPRIAWEGAYLVTVMLVLMIVFPGSPFAAVSNKALATIDPLRIERPFVALDDSINNGAQELWIATYQTARNITKRTSTGSTGLYRQARQEIGTLWDRIASDPVNDLEQPTPQQAFTNGESK